MNKEQTTLVADTMLLALTHCFMKSPPREWEGKHESAIEVKLPMPDPVIKALSEFREQITDAPFEIDFNHMLSLFLGDMVFNGLAMYIQRLDKADGKEMLKRIKNFTNKEGD